MTVGVERDEIIRTVQPVVEGQGFDLVAVQVAKAGRRSLVRILADRPAGGIQLSECAQISRAVSAALEALDGAAGPYTLEVSSPGLDFRCEALKDFRRYRGQSMTLQLLDGRQVSGTLTAAEEAGLVLDNGETYPTEQVRYGTRNH